MDAQYWRTIKGDYLDIHSMEGATAVSFSRSSCLCAKVEDGSLSLGLDTYSIDARTESTSHHETKKFEQVAGRGCPKAPHASQFSWGNIPFFSTELQQTVCC